MVGGDGNSGGSEEKEAEFLHGARLSSTHLLHRKLQWNNTATAISHVAPDNSTYCDPRKLRQPIRAIPIHDVGASGR